MLQECNTHEAPTWVYVPVQPFHWWSEMLISWNVPREGGVDRQEWRIDFYLTIILSINIKASPLQKTLGLPFDMKR